MIGLLIAWSMAARAEVTLTQDGKPVAVLVHNGYTNQAASLQTYLAKITGTNLPFVATAAEAAGRPAIVLEIVDKVPGAGARPEIARQAYRIVTEGQVLRLTGGSDMGLTYAVWGFLEDHLGCRFYTFKATSLTYTGPGFEVVPSQPTLKIGKIDDFQQPAFAQRGMTAPDAPTWMSKNRAGGYPINAGYGSLSATHNFHHLVPPTDRGSRKGLFAEHPEFYPLNKAGKREVTPAMGLCGANPDLPKYLAAALQEDIEQNMESCAKRGVKYDPGVPMAVGQGDGFSGCLCDACRKLVKDEQSEAAPYILMLNRALDILAAKYPKQQVITFAYFATLPAPKTIRPHKNLWVCIVTSDLAAMAAGDTVGPMLGNPANRDYAAALRDWCKIAPNRVANYHWTQGPVWTQDITEWPVIFYWADTMRYWQECGLYGVNQYLYTENWKWLDGWVHYKLAWNPKADADALIRQFLEDNYGRGAAPYVWDYLKLAQAAYADSGHVPNPCRWTGFLTTTRLKIYSPSVLKKMTTLMDKAMNAARKEKNPALFTNLVEARGSSVDHLTIDAARAEGNWGPVKNPEDGKRWFVPAADPRIPACLARVRQSIVAGGGGEFGFPRNLTAFSCEKGGPVVDLDSGTLSAAVCPDLKGQVTSAMDKRSGKELLAVVGAETGYRDMFSVTAQIWLPVPVAEKGYNQPGSEWLDVWSRFVNPSGNSLETDLTLSPSYWGFDPNNHLRRSVTVGEGGLKIERTYVQSKGGKMPSPTRFTTRWLLAVPDPAKANVAVSGGGIAKTFDLRSVASAGVAGVAKAGERKSVSAATDRFVVDNVTGADGMPVVRTIALPVASNSTDTITIQLDRGDGVATVLSTPAAGWATVELQPVVDKKHVRVTLVGVPVAMGPDPVTNALPAQTLSAKKVPVVKVLSDTSDMKPATPKIKDLGNGRAINELDGAELVWIPADEFLRGSPEGKGCSDERPQKKIFLDGYWIYKHPVTLAQYTNFCAATGKKFEPTWGQDMHAEPVGEAGTYAALMNWFEADAYAKWAGAALPSEAQWEKAARGTDGREYPWGNDWDPEKAVGLERTTYRFTSGLMPVGSSPAGASPYGVEDMAGNCWEWVADWYAHEYYATALAKNPTGPATGTHKVLRGGFALFDERFSRSAARMVHPPQVRDWTAVGFRCVVNGTSKAAP